MGSPSGVGHLSARSPRVYGSENHRKIWEDEKREIWRFRAGKKQKEPKGDVEWDIAFLYILSQSARICKNIGCNPAVI